MGSSVGRGPSSHPRGWCPQPSGDGRCSAPQLIYRQREAQGREGALLTIPRLPSSSPSLLPSFILQIPNLQGPTHPPPSDRRPMCPAGCLLWDIPRTHDTHHFQNQTCHPPPNPLSPPSPSQVHYLPVTQARHLGVMPGTYSPSASSLPGATFPTVLRSSPFSLTHLANQWLLGTDCARHRGLGLWQCPSRRSLQRAGVWSGRALEMGSDTSRWEAFQQRQGRWSRVRPQVELSALVVGVSGEEPRAPEFLE